MKNSKDAPNEDFKNAIISELKGLVSNGYSYQPEERMYLKICALMALDEIKRVVENTRHKIRPIAE